MMSETDAAMADEKAGKKSGALSGRQCPDVSSAVKATGSASAARSIRESPEMPSFSANTLSATEEARRISRDPGVRGYSTMEDLKAALES
jgi:DNA-damage-inducible protein J